METYAVVLTKGAYIVSAETAHAVLLAIERSDPHILIEADILGDGMFYSPVRLVTAHVVAIVENTASTAGVSERGSYPLRPVRT